MHMRRSSSSLGSLGLTTAVELPPMVPMQPLIYYRRKRLSDVLILFFNYSAHSSTEAKITNVDALEHGMDRALFGRKAIKPLRRRETFACFDENVSAACRICSGSFKVPSKLSSELPSRVFLVFGSFRETTVFFAKLSGVVLFVCLALDYRIGV